MGCKAHCPLVEGLAWLRFFAGYELKRVELPSVVNVNMHELREKTVKTDMLIKRVEYLAEELRRLGIRPIQRTWHD